MRRHAREPLPLMRRLRYQMGRWLCGSRPFAPWLQRDEWERRLVRLGSLRVRSASEGVRNRRSHSGSEGGEGTLIPEAAA